MSSSNVECLLSARHLFGDTMVKGKKRREGGGERKKEGREGGREGRKEGREEGRKREKEKID